MTESTPDRGGVPVSYSMSFGQGPQSPAGVSGHLVSPPRQQHGTSIGSFVLSGSFEEEARIASAASTPEPSPTGVPYPSIAGQTIVPVDLRGIPHHNIGSPSLRSTRERPHRPISTLSRAAIRAQSFSAWDLFRDVTAAPFEVNDGLVEAVDRYNRAFKAESDALDYEPAEPGDSSVATPERMTVAGVFSPISLLRWFLFFIGSLLFFRV